ncbi:metallophosphoesterase [Sporosarcina sp. CAU 1771]
MKIVVMSDSHDDVGTVEAVSSLQGDATFHCGDSELEFEHPFLSHMHKVRGNCDFDSSYPNHVIVSIGGKTIFMVHGHEHNVNQSLLSLHYAALENNADIVLFGHTHLYGASMIEGVLFVNPGSTMQPRGGKHPTYAVIEWDKTIRVTFNNMEHKQVDFIELKNI